MDWKAALKATVLKVKMAKTKVMRCHDGAEIVEKVGKELYSVCRKGVGCNSILCTRCRFGCIRIVAVQED